MKKLHTLFAALSGMFLLGFSSLAAAQERAPAREPLEGNINQEAQTEGCWITIYDEENFGRDAPGVEESTVFERRVLGPLTVLELDSPRAITVLGKNWDETIESVVVGPNAQVCFFEEDNLESESLCLRPGSKVAEMDEFDLGDDVESMVIQCQ